MAGVGFACGLASLALSCGLIACSKQSDTRGQAAPDNVVVAAPPAARPAALPPAQALAAAFAVAFPGGAVVGKGDDQLTYEPEKLVPLPGGDHVALLAEGSNDDTCHDCTGKLRVTYLARTGAGFAPLALPIETTIDGDGFGGPPSWKLAENGRVPLLTIGTGYMAQGCTETRSTVYRLETAGVVRDRTATRQGADGC
jgi:hypothetical protein